jgi:hypothetical protein
VEVCAVGWDAEVTGGADGAGASAIARGIREDALGPGRKVMGRAILGITISHFASGPDGRNPAGLGAGCSMIAGTDTAAGPADLAGGGVGFGRVCAGVSVR